MRKRFDAQIGLGETAIEEVTIPLNSRDELPPILAGLQWMFKTQEIQRCRKLFSCLGKAYAQT